MMRLRQLFTSCIPIAGLVAACDVAEPPGLAYEPAIVTLAYVASPCEAPPGWCSAFQKSDSLSLRLRDNSDSTRLLAVVGFESTRDTIVTRLVQLKSSRETFDFELEFRSGRDTLFRLPARQILLRAGRDTTATAEPLEPVLARVLGPQFSDTLFDAYFDAITLPTDAAGVFATGDTLRDFAIRWSSLDPAVAQTLDNGTRLISQDRDGLATLVATAVSDSFSFTDSAMVRVEALVDSIAITPPDTAIQIHATQMYSATLWDRLGHPITAARKLTWSSSDGDVVSIDPTGLASAVGLDTARIVATSGRANAEARLRVTPAAPCADLLNATFTGPGPALRAAVTALVDPNGAQTRAGFEWGEAALPRFLNLRPMPQAIVDGIAPVTLSDTLGPLKPNTLYFVRVFASNTVGISNADCQKAPLPVDSALVIHRVGPTVTTDSATAASDSAWTLWGSVNANGSNAEWWFEWGTDSTLNQSSSTHVRTGVAGFSATVVSDFAAPTAPATTYYYRAAARNEASTAYGAIKAFTTPKQPPQPPTVTTLCALDVAATTATLRGTVKPNGEQTGAWFEWGTDSLLTAFNSTSVQAMGSGTTAVPLDAGLTGLVVGRSYWYRAAASSIGGTSTGNVLKFTTVENPDRPDRPCGTP